MYDTLLQAMRVHSIKLRSGERRMVISQSFNQNGYFNIYCLKNKQTDMKVGLMTCVHRLNDQRLHVASII